MPKNIVVCGDGTDSDVTTDSTNVLRLFRMLERDQRQVAYYDAGVGTLVDPEAITVWRKVLSRQLDAAIGFGGRENVIARHRLLAPTHRPGQQILRIRHALSIDERRACFPSNQCFPQEEQKVNCKQVWFAGVHGDVGGGYPEAAASLAKVPLAWMIREAEALGLLINADQRQYLMDSKDKPPPRPCRPIHQSLTRFVRRT